MAIVGWRSPLTGTISITGAVIDTDSGGGDGILWYIDRDSSDLASGGYANGGSQNFRDGSGGNGLANIAINAGEFIYFVIHPNIDDTYDTTELDISINVVSTTYSISGRVSDSSNNPIAGVTISAGSSLSATTNAGGYYTITNLITGTYALTPIKGGYTFSPPLLTVSVPPNATGQNFTGTPQTASGKPPVILVHGFHGIPIFGTPSSCSTGVLHYPDEWDFTDFDPIPAWLMNDFDIWVAHLTTSPRYTPPLEYNAGCLQDQINKVYNLPGNNGQKIILIAHSMGGLVSRAVIEAAPDYYDRVSVFITLGSPHQGIPDNNFIFKLGCLRESGTCQLSESYIKNIFNPRYSKRNARVRYYTVGGLETNKGIRFDERSGDGIIPLTSANGLSNSTRFTTNETHADPPFGYPTYMQYAQGNTISYGPSFRCVIRPILYCIAQNELRQKGLGNN